MTNENIPMECPECPDKHFEEGYSDMLKHVLKDHHGLYSKQEAIDTCLVWLDDAWERHYMEEIEYSEYMKKGGDND